MDLILTADHCRVCLKLAAGDPDLSTSKHLPTLSEKLKVTDDDLPRKLCSECSKFLDELKKFDERCKETERILEQLRMKPDVIPMTYEINIKEEYFVTDVEDPSDHDFDQGFNVGEKDSEDEVKADPEKVKTQSLDPKQEPEKVSLRDFYFPNLKKKKRKLDNVKDYDFEALEKYLLENNLKTGTLEQIVFQFKSPKDRKNLQKNCDTTHYEFQKRYRCDYCKRVIQGPQLSGIEILNTHVKSCHSPSEIVVTACVDCNCSFTSSTAEEHHYEVSSKCRGGEKYKTQDFLACSYCDLIAPSNKNGMARIQNHFNSRHSSLPSFRYPEILRAHYKQKKHLKSLPLCRPLQCNFCTFTCCLAANMSLHVQNYHPDSIGQLPKCTCGATEFCDDLLLQHVLLRCSLAEKHLSLPFKNLFIVREVSTPKIINTQKSRCPVCNREVKTNNLYKHLEAHANPAGLRYMCDLCGKTYGTKLNIKTHMQKIHLQNLFYTCKYCHGQFRDWSAMDYHVKMIHDNSLLVHTCDVCGKRFASSYRLREHETLHTKLKPYQCDLCHLAFRKKKQLNFHMAVHTDVRSMVCTICGKTFKNRKAVRQHLKTHEDRAFTCPVCDMTFTTGHTLRIHVTSKHPEFPMPPPGTALRNVDLRKYLPQNSLMEFD